MTAESDTRTDCPVQNARSRKKTGCLLAAAVVILILAVIAVVFLGTPRRWEISPVPTVLEMLTLRQLIGKLSSAMINEEGELVSTATVELNPDEINTLLNNMMRMAQKQLREQRPGVYSLAQWENGAVQIRISCVIWLLAVNSEFQLIPSVRDGNLSFTARNCRVGWFPLSSAVVTEGLHNAVQELKNQHPEYQAVMKTILALNVAGDRIRLTFRPQELQSMLPMLLQNVYNRYDRWLSYRLPWKVLVPD